MTQSKGPITAALLSGLNEIQTSELPTLQDWLEIYSDAASSWETPMERAIIGGFISDRLAYAFAAGYQNALTHLFPDLSSETPAALCVTEEGGGHPGAIKCLLKKKDTDTWFLNGTKSFVTQADTTRVLFVAASTGKKSDGKNDLRMVRIETASTGIDIKPGKKLPFIPEISHGTLICTDVPVAEGSILPGDGYSRYIKPFRSIEDLFVFSSTAAYMVRCAALYAWPRSIIEKLIAIIFSLQSLAEKDLTLPETHIVLSGLQSTIEHTVLETAPLWEKVTDDEAARWKRDSGILKVAGNVRKKRTESAWLTFS